MEMKYIDVHSHVSFPEFDADREAVLARMHEAGVGTIAVGVDLKSSQAAIACAEKYQNVWVSIGAHPHDDTTFVFDEKDFESLVSHPKVVAIGECGLDYFRLPTDAETEKLRQKKEFVKQIEFAVKHKKPLMLHVRDAYADAYEILKLYEGRVVGNMHFFAGDLAWAKKFTELGFTLSFTGVITFANQYDEIIKNIPLEMMHVETDAPYVAPVPYRGKRNEPAYVVEVVKKIAELRGEDEEKVRAQLLENAKRVFGI